MGDGQRVAKHDSRVAAYGKVDEANATIGLARLHVDGKADAVLARIQNDLFDLGADLCTPEGGRRSAGALRITAEQVAWHMLSDLPVFPFRMSELPPPLPHILAGEDIIPYNPA